MKKRFLTYEQQIEKLQTEKELTISNVPFAISTLEHISYYALIGGYKNLFKHKPSGKYLYGVMFEEITAFYYFCEKFGEAQAEYLNSNNFNSAKKNQKAVERLITSLEKAISFPTHYNYIAHYAKNHHNVPLWVAMNAITFGQLSAFYQYMPNEIQSKVSKHFPGYSEKQLHQFITIVAKCRNVCAHGERLFDFRTSDTIPDTFLHKKLNIPMKKGNYLFAKHTKRRHSPYKQGLAA